MDQVLSRSLLTCTEHPLLVSTSLKISDIRGVLSEGLFGVEMDAETVASVDDLFQSFSEKFHFPDYFGKNWAALSETPSVVSIVMCS